MKDMLWTSVGVLAILSLVVSIAAAMRNRDNYNGKPGYETGNELEAEYAPEIGGEYADTNFNP